MVSRGGEGGSVGAFGSPDGSRAELDDIQSIFITMPSKFGEAWRFSSKQPVRIVTGKLGAGKSLYLRKLRQETLRNNSVYAPPVNANLAHLSTELVARTAQYYPRSANTEKWKEIWYKAIQRSAVSVLTTLDVLRTRDNEELIENLRQYHRLTGRPRNPRNVTQAAREILAHHQSSRTLDEYLDQDEWVDLEVDLLNALEKSRPLYLYVDAIDDNFKWAPSYWMSCQKGLFYAVMDEQRLQPRLHVVAAIRDVVLASSLQGEHGLRYDDPSTVTRLVWTRDALSYFLDHKISSLPETLLAAPNESDPIVRWLGLSSITNRQRRVDEDIRAYFLRHTRMVPRDVVILGNAICARVSDLGRPLGQSDLIEVVHDRARLMAKSQLGQVGNQVMTDVMPWNATSLHFDDAYLSPDEYTVDALVSAIREIMQRVISNEELDLATLEELDEETQRSFGESARLVDVLWQNGLLGQWSSKNDRFEYCADLTGSTSTIDRSVRRFVLHPIMLDVLHGIEVAPGAGMLADIGWKQR